MPKQMGMYEKACKFAENLLKMKPAKKKAEEYARDLAFCHVEVPLR